MADKESVETETVPPVVEEVEKEKVKSISVEEKKEVEKEEKKCENGAGENGTTEKEEEESKNGDDATDTVCTVKRKSVGTETKEPEAEGVTPEKKAKLDEPVEKEANGDTEVAA